MQQGAYVSGCCGAGGPPWALLWLLSLIALGLLCFWIGRHWERDGRRQAIEGLIAGVQKRIDHALEAKDLGIFVRTQALADYVDARLGGFPSFGGELKKELDRVKAAMACKSGPPSADPAAPMPKFVTQMVYDDGKKTEKEKVVSVHDLARETRAAVEAFQLYWRSPELRRTLARLQRCLCAPRPE